jgi:hypothetical protein
MRSQNGFLHLTRNTRWNISCPTCASTVRSQRNCRRFAGESNGLFTLEESRQIARGETHLLSDVRKGADAHPVFGLRCMVTNRPPTLALMDIFRFLSRNRSFDDLLTRTTLCFVPMLNPDGAERLERHSAPASTSTAMRDLSQLRKPAYCVSCIASSNLSSDSISMIRN